MRRYLIIFALIGAAWGQTCSITNTKPIGVVTGGALSITTSNCPGATYSVACTGSGCVSGSIDVLGNYTAPTTWRPYNYSRGIQLLPNNSIYNYPINALPLDSRSTMWVARVAAWHPCPGPDCVTSYHNLKPGFAPIGLNGFYNNIVYNSTPKQLMHSNYSGNSGPYQNTLFPFLSTPEILIQNGLSQDVNSNQDRHYLAANIDNNIEYEQYQVIYDFENIVVTPGSTLTTINYTTNVIRPMQNPVRIFIRGVTGSCATALNYNSTANNSFVATVVTAGTLTIPFNSSSCGVGAFNSTTLSSNVYLCPTCNVGSVAQWPAYSNAIVGGTDAAGSPIAATTLDMQQWYNNTVLATPDPNCGGCVTAAQHVLRTNLANAAISPRNLLPAVLGAGVTGGHPNMILTNGTNAATVTFTTSFDMSRQSPCEVPVNFSWSIGCTFHVVFSGMTGAWAGLNGNVDGHSYIATSLSTTTFTIPVDTTTFGTQTWTNNQHTFIFDWMPYGTRLRLKSSFDINTWANTNCNSGAQPYCKSFLHLFATYGVMNLDGTSPGDNWDTGIMNAWFQPNEILDALKALRTLGPLEQYLEIVDESAIPTFGSTQVYTDPTNQLQTTANQRIVVTVTSSNGTATADINPIGTGITVDPERITMFPGSTFQPVIRVNGNSNAGFSCAITPITGASVGLFTGLITAPSAAQVASMIKGHVTCTSTADSSAIANMTVFFVPISSDSSYRLNIGQHTTTFVDHTGQTWWGQYANCGNCNLGAIPTYEQGDGFAFAAMNGTWTLNSANWSATTDAQLYAQSTSTLNDAPFRVALPNGTYTVTLYGEAGYGIAGAGLNVFDVEINGTNYAQFQDGYVLAGGVYKPYTLSYLVNVTTGVLNIVQRIREYDTGGHGMSLSSILITPGSCPLSITTPSLPNGSVGVAYSQTLAATCGTPPYTWSITSGSLPTGLSLNAGTGVISGTPTVQATFPFTIKVTDSAAGSATHAFSIIVNNAPITITTASLPSGVVGTPYTTTLAATGGTPPYSWSVSFGGIPGVAMNSSTGVYSGTPTTPGLFSVSIRVTDAVSTQANKAFPTTIINPSPSASRIKLTGGNSVNGGVSIQ